MSVINSPKQITFGLKLLIHITGLLLIVINFYLGSIGQLGGDPVERLLHVTGLTAFKFLLISLTITPFSRILRTPILMPVRRMVGLWAFTFALLHLTVYVVFELQFDWPLLFSEIIKRPYITVGAAALVILSLLAATSTKSVQKRMGPAWQKLHNWVYLAAVLVALHFIWSVKSDILEPLIYWAILLLLLSFRRKKLIKGVSKLKH